MNNSAYMRNFKNQISQRGLSLVELMISITIGLLILAALATLFVNQSKTRIELDKSNRLIDNGRYALEVLSENLRLAGFYGEREYSVLGEMNLYDSCTRVNGAMTNALSFPVGGWNTPGLPVDQVDIPYPVYPGYDATAASGVGAIIDNPPCNLTTADLKPGNDILVLRRADTTSIPVADVDPGRHYIQVSNCKEDAATAIIGTTAANFTLRQRDCTSAANVRRFFVQTYFISFIPPHKIGDDPIPTLTLKELDPAEIDSSGEQKFITTFLVEGIEFLQVDYGIDGDKDADGLMDDLNGDGVVSDGDKDGAADSYVTTCATAVCWSNVVSVRLNIIARNTEPTAGYTNTNTYTLGHDITFRPPLNDSYKRHVYTQVVRLINPSSRRERP